MDGRNGVRWVGQECCLYRLHVSLLGLSFPSPSQLARSLAGIEQDKGLEHVSMSDAATCPNVFVYFTGYSYSYKIGSAEADKEGLVFGLIDAVRKKGRVIVSVSITLPALRC